MRLDKNGPQMLMKSERGIFWFLQTGDGSSITAGVARKDHAFSLVKSGFTTADAALRWVLSAKTRSEFDRGLHDLGCTPATDGACT